jgi:hypothetical protein
MPKTRNKRTKEYTTVSDTKETFRVERADLYAPGVEEYLDLQRAVQRDAAAIPQQPLVIRVIYSSWFYLAIASGLGAFVAWAVLEPFIDESNPMQHESDLVLLLVFPSVAGCIGLFLGAAEGLMCRNLGRAAISGLVGLGIGAGGGLISIFAGGIIFVITSAVALQLDKGHRQGELPTGFAFLVLMMGRGAAWAVAGIPAGLGQGIALREKKVMFNGIVGGVLGGLIGGFLFDPICALLSSSRDASVSRGVGFTIIGLMVGLFVGLVEGWTKTAWLLMRAGPLAGKQFVLFRDTTVLGSSPKAEIYLFKDEAIEPRHAIIINRGGRFEIEDCNSQDGTYVNGVPIKRQLLANGDQIVMGKTVLEFQLKESG